MRIADADPELRGPLRRMPKLPARNALVRRLAQTALARMAGTPTPGVTISTPIPGAPGIRLYRPDSPATDAALLWIHGGGLIIGAPVQDDRLCGELAQKLGITIASVHYRLAPDHPFPAPLDDCVAGWEWLEEHAAELGVDPARIVVAGQSAGGCLAAALVQRLVDQGGVQPIGQLLFCPMLDDRTATRRDLDGEHLVWGNRVNRFAWSGYLGVPAGSAAVPDYSVPARRGSLAGMPPTWVGYSDIELFHDEDAEYARRLGEAGVPVTTRVVPDAPHGFEAWAPDSNLARTHIAAAIDWLRDVIAPGPRSVG